MDEANGSTWVPADPQCEHRYLDLAWWAASHPMAKRTWKACGQFHCRQCGVLFEPVFRLELTPADEARNTSRPEGRGPDDGG